MKTMRDDLSGKKLEREKKVERIICNLNGREFSIDAAVKKYHEQYDDDKNMSYKVMSIILKDMCDRGLLSKERRSIKENKNGRVEKKNVIYYKEADKIVVKKPIITSTPEEKNGLELEEKKEEKINTVPELLSKLTFAEALEKLYTGHKIVSGVSGNIYTIMNINGQKGVTSSAEPGVIMSFFPSLEMVGSWRVMEAPKDCPFCGYPVKLNHETLGEKAYYYCCTNKNCCAHGPRASTPELAVVKFNERS